MAYQYICKNPLRRAKVLEKGTLNGIEDRKSVV